MPRPRFRSVFLATAVLTGTLAVTPTSLGPIAQALDNTPWYLPSTPPKCTQQQANSGNVAGCIVAFYEDPASTGWGTPPAPGVGEGWTWNGFWYNGSPALAGWEATYITSNSQPVGGLRTGSLRTHVSAQALFEGFLDEIAANGYRVRDATGYGFRCTAGNGGWTCPSGDPDDLSNHAWGLAIDMNASTNPIRSYTSTDGGTACAIPIETDLPQWVIQTAEKWGLYWGGYGWNSGCQSTETQRTTVDRDPPHFEFRGTPEQAAAIAGFNLRNDPDAVCRMVVDESGDDVERCALNARPQAGWRLPIELDPPVGAEAALINLTATDAAAAGYLTIEDCEPRSGVRTTSALTYAVGDSVASMAIVPLSSDGRFCLYRSSAVHTVVDVAAYVGPSEDGSQPMWFEPETPTRLTDTRMSGACAPGGACVPGPVPAGGTHVVPTTDGDARIVNLTVIDSGAPTWLQVGRCADVGPAGEFSNLNVANASARANLALIPPSDSGVCAFALSSGHVIVDQLGRLDATEGLGWSLVPTRRSIDTRECADQWCEGRPVAGQLIPVDLGTDAPAAAIAVTVTDAAAAGFVTVGRCDVLAAGGGSADTSNVNYGRGSTATGLAIVALDDGQMCVYTRSPAHVIIDVQAELTTGHELGLLPVDPTRAHDSRLADAPV